MILIDQPLQISLLVAAGAMAILFFGRKLFWLYVGVVGLLAGFELSAFYFPNSAVWIYLLCGAILGIVLALVAMALQYVAAGMAGFLGGSYLSVQFIELAPMFDVAEIQWVVFAIAGVAGAIFCVALFNPALILLSALTGSAVLVQLFQIDPLMQSILFAVLATAGIFFQYSIYVRARE